MLINRQWLPNQLLSVYDQMLEVEKDQGELPECTVIMDLVKSQRKNLMKEVERYRADRDQ